jgi:cytochrome P450
MTREMGDDVRRLVDRFDHHDPAYAVEGAPAAIFDEIRSGCPVKHTDAWGGYWVVTRYDDVATVAKDPATFSNRRSVTIPPSLPDDAPMPEKPLGIPLMVDPPEFGEWRRMLNPWFSPQTTERLVPGMRELTNRLIDEFVETGSADLYDDLVSPMPAITICRIVGLPEEEWHSFADPVHESLQRHPSEQLSGDAQAAYSSRHAASAGRMLEIAEQRRAEPKDDLLTHLVQAEVFGRPLEPMEIAQIANIMVAGGVDTTTNAVGAQLVHLGRNPELRRRLAASPELIPSAIEEFLRVWSPFQGLGRFVLRDTVVGGQEIKAGEKVWISWQAANLDPAEFPDPHEIVVDRQPNRHIAFGLGIHRCIGAHLARAEMRVVLEELLRRVPDFEVGDARLQPDCGLIYGYATIPATFPPGRREG